MKRIIKLTESDLTNIVKRVIEEDKESLEREARIILNGIGYSMTVLKSYTRKELAKTLRRENKDRSGGHDKWEKLSDKLDN
jgi:nucleoid DNA-binding protein